MDRRSVTDDEPNDSVIEIPAGLEQESTVVSVGRTMNRRTLLRTVGWVAAAAAAGVAVVEIVRRGTSSTVGVVTEALSFRRPSSPAPALAAGIHPNLVGLAPAVTPNADFFQIDTSMAAPDIDTGTWAFTIDGRVDHPLTLTYAELLALPSIERHITLACVSNDVGGDLVGTARWQGVRLSDLLKQVGVRADADAVVGVSVDGFTAGFPLAVLADGRDAMVAYAMNGEPLPAKHGFPARLVVPGLYGYVSATKWLSQIRLTTLADDVPFWLGRGWSADGTVEAASRIDVPRDGVAVATGRVDVGGRAWHQHAAVGTVEISVDGGDWQRVTLADSMGTDCWRLWSWSWDAAVGTHELRVRMIDDNGTLQDAAERPTFPGAASGLHTIKVDVRPS